MMPHCLPQKHSHQLQENRKHETRRKESEQAASHLPRQPRRTIVQRNGGTTIHAIGHRGLVLNRKMRHQRKGSRATIRSAGGWGVSGEENTVTLEEGAVICHQQFICEKMLLCYVSTDASFEAEDAWIFHMQEAVNMSSLTFLV